MKNFILWCALALAPVGLVVPACAQKAPNLSSAPLKWPTIKPGEQEGYFNNPVGAIQHLLRAQGFYKGRVDGVYGPKTVAAIKAFQRKNGLKADGVAGPQTLPKLVVTLRRGSRSEAVRAAQVLARDARDQDAGTPNEGIEVDGIYGQETERAVKIAQFCQNDTDRGDCLKVDGIMGPRSWCLMLGGGVVGQG